MANVSKEKKKAEAIARMKTLGIDLDVIKRFEKDGQIYRWNDARGLHMMLDADVADHIKRVEEEYNVLVYFVIESYMNHCLMECYLFVSDYEDDWKLDHEGLKIGEQLAYVDNWFLNGCSEFGSIGIALNSDGGLTRKW